jgi:hypothetical protein
MIEINEKKLTAGSFLKVIAPQIKLEVVRSLEKLKFVTLITDTSNRNAEKMLPILARGFDDEKGVVVFKLEIKTVTDEKAATIEKELIDTAKEWKIQEKLIGFGADNCPTNFGGEKRNGKNNVFARLKLWLVPEIVGIGCSAHIIHNAFDSACDQLPIDVEALVVNIYKFFHIHTIRTEALKEICDEVGAEYKTLTNHSGTRFLSLLPAVSKVNYLIFRKRRLMPFVWRRLPCKTSFPNEAQLD